MSILARSGLLAWLAAGASLGLVACETRSGQDADMGIPRSSSTSSTTAGAGIPAMDADAPAVIQTATFALG
jgi:hypothetical protein